MNHRAVDAITRPKAQDVSGSMSSMQSLVLPQVLFLTDLAGKSQSEGFSEMLDLQKFSKVSQEKLWSPCWSKRQNGDDADFVNQILVYNLYIVRCSMP